MAQHDPGRQRRVMYVHANNDEVGGADFCLFKMAREIRAHGWTPLVVLRRRTPIVSLYERDGIQISIAPLSRIRKTANPLRLGRYALELPASVAALRRLAREHRADLIHTNDLLDVAGNIAARTLGIATCQHVRMIVRTPAPLQKALSASALTFSGNVICVSKGVRDAMFAGQLSPRVIYDWPDMEAVGHTRPKAGGRTLRQELGIEGSVRLVGCVGRLDPWKGQDLFVAAAAAVSAADPNVHFVIVGGETATKEEFARAVGRRCEAHGHSAQISMLGHRDDIESVMRQLDVLVHSSLLPDPFPGVVLEGLLSGPIVVAAAGGGVPEQIRNGDTGFLYTPGDLDDLVRAIRQALRVADPTAMSDRARADINTRFSKSVLVAELARFYEDVMNEHESRAR